MCFILYFAKKHANFIYLKSDDPHSGYYTDLESKRQEITALTDIIQQLRTENGPLVFLREQLAQFVSTHSQRFPIAAGPAPASNSTNTSEGDAQNPAQVQHTQQQQQRYNIVNMNNNYNFSGNCWTR